jgi:hypothetical protein
MYQDTTQQVSDNNVYEAGFGFGQMLVTIVKLPFVILGKVVGSVLYGFNIFADTAEQYGPPRN